MPVVIPFNYPYVDVADVDISVDSAFASNQETTVYTVPTGKVAYWIDFFVSVTNEDVVKRASRLFIYDDDDTELWRITTNAMAGTGANFNALFNPPHKLTAGQYITYRSYVADVDAYVSIRYIEIDA